MPEMRHELAVGESVVIDDYLLTVEDIRGEDVLFRIERIPALSLPAEGGLPTEACWAPDARMSPADLLTGEGLADFNPDEVGHALEQSSPRSRPR